MAGPGTFCLHTAVREADLRLQYDKLQAIIEAQPNNQEVRVLLPELEAGLAAADATLKPLLEQLAALQAKLPQEPEPAAPKFDPEKHPLLKKTLEKPEPAQPVVFNAGDTCEAQWTDKAWYKAKIQTILGSASNPKYHVRFLEYDDTMTLDRDRIRPLQSKRKREPEAAPAPAAVPAPQTAAVTSTPHVISGPASVNPNAQAAKIELPTENGDMKKRKIPNKKQLEKGVSNWKNWNSKGVGKKLSQKESMFRTGTTVNSRGDAPLGPRIDS